jgi:hypothetical protein
MFGSEYDQLFARLVTLLDGFGQLGVFTLDEWEERVALADCEASGMTPERWDRLGHQARIPWMEMAIASLTRTPPIVKATEREPDARSPEVNTDGKQPPSLTQEDAAILKVLLQANPVTMIVGNIESKVCFTDKTIRRRLKKLRTLELVCEPEKNKGYTTTTKGADAAKKLPNDAGAKLIRSERVGR